MYPAWWCCSHVTKLEASNVSTKAIPRLWNNLKLTRSVQQSAEKTSFFSYIRMGSRGTFVLCTARSRCMRIDAAPDQQLDSRTSQG